MSQKEVKKYDIIKKVISRELNGSEAAGLLDLTARQVRRLKGRVNRDGIKGLIHGNRGKPSNRRMPDKERSRIADLHKKLNEQEKKKLDSIFSRQYVKSVMNDFTISHKNNCYQLGKIQPATICKQDRVTIEERLDKTIRIRLRGKYLNYQLLPEKPKKMNDKKNLQWVIPGSKGHIPSTNHPWRQTAKMEYLKKLTKASTLGHF